MEGISRGHFVLFLRGIFTVLFEAISHYVCTVNIYVLKSIRGVKILQLIN